MSHEVAATPSGPANICAERIHSPDELKSMSITEMEHLCSDLRRDLINTISHTGGHLSSNLGVVELTVALHKVFRTPTDQIVWDVGHQCYVHKMLTGRARLFDTLRKENGLSGFPSPRESIHDAFIAGHSSTAISAANGLAKAKALLGEDGYVIAIVGDGAMTGGLAYEGLSNAGRSKDKIIIILNDNGMSIGKNVGYVARHLAALKARPRYVKFKATFSDMLAAIPLVGRFFHDRILGLKISLKNMIYHHSKFFEEMGYAYIGPLNGHDIEDLVKGMEAAKRIGGPVVLHVATVKGKGFEFAERNPDIYHGVSGFDIETGIAAQASKSFSAVFGEEICELAANDERISTITAAMSDNVGLKRFAELYPKRAFDVGIAEGHAVTFAAGLAHNNSLPVFAVFSTFLQRSYDQILNDAAIIGENITLAIDRAGITGDDGETHQGIFDVAFLNTIPGITIYSPCCYAELKINLRQAVYDVQGISAVRYPRGGQPESLADYTPDYKPYTLHIVDSDILIITYGRIFAEALTALERLKSAGIPVSLLKLNRIKPLDGELIDIIAGYKKIFFFEEGIRNGGTGEYLGSRLLERDFLGSYRVTALDGFVPVCRPDSWMHKVGLDADGMTATVTGVPNDEN